jgi:hypothetical protein
VSTGAIVAIGVVTLLMAGLVPLRVAVARQRRAVQAVRDRLAAAGEVRRHAKGAVLVTQKIGTSTTSVSRPATCALTADGLYCVGDDGFWGARVRLAPGAPEVGDVVMVDAPGLVVNGNLVDPTNPATLHEPRRGALPVDGLMLQFQGGLGWFVSVPDADQWYAALIELAPPRAAPSA